jgi:hypothetical protein
MIFVRQGSFRVLLLFALLTLGGAESQGQERPQVREQQNGTIGFLPAADTGAPGFAPLLVDRLLPMSFSAGGALKTVPLEAPELSELGPKELRSAGPARIASFLRQKAESAGLRYAGVAGVRKEGERYYLHMYLLDRESGDLVLDGTKAVEAVEDFDQVIDQFRNEFLRAEYPDLAKSVGDAGKAAAGAKEPAEEVERKGELTEDEEAAAREREKERLKEEARREVEEERIRELYRRDRAKRRKALQRSAAFWASVGGYGVQTAADLAADVSGQLSVVTAETYSQYLRGSSYRQYRQFQEDVGAWRTAAYVSSAAGSGALGTAFLLGPADTWRLTDTGRDLLAASVLLQTAGRGAALLAGRTGLAAAELRHEYEIANSDFDSLYGKYRGLHVVYAIERISAYALTGLSVGGTVTAVLLRGEERALAFDDASRRWLGAGSFLYGTGAAAAQVAVNLAQQGTEAYMKESAGGPAGVAEAYEIYALVADFLAVTLYAAAAGCTLRGLYGGTAAQSVDPSGPGAGRAPQLVMQCYPAAGGGITMGGTVWW